MIREKLISQPIDFVEVTQRDGEQQEKAQEFMSPEDRITVFDAIVDTGIYQAEIGQLFNVHDQEYARHLIQHINHKSAQGDECYDRVVLQVLFGGREGEIEAGVPALEGFPKDRIVMHVYDRLSPNLRGLATHPYTTQQSAERVTQNCLTGIRHGFTRFSISGEGTVDPGQVTVKEAVDFFKPIVTQVWQAGATAVNVNLANTFGVTLHDIGEWNFSGLQKFNKRVKKAYSKTTTSIHTHDDNTGGVEYALAAVKAGFNKIEGSLTGMGERSGNVALVNIMARYIENARIETESSTSANRKIHMPWAIGKSMLRGSIWRERYINETILGNLHNWYRSAVTMSDVYQTHDRFGATSLGSPNAYKAGCGPHGGANERSIQNPVRYPFWKNYGRIALVRAMMGDPKAMPLIRGDIAAHRAEVIETHAAGGSISRVRAYEGIVPAIQEVQDKAEQQAREEMRSIVSVMTKPSNQTNSHEPQPMHVLSVDTNAARVM